ncbi:hypothetical protein EV715DRAFT_209635, partial [Schizophyllum commune]
TTWAPIKKTRSQALYARLPRGSLILVSPSMASDQIEDSAGSFPAPTPDRQCERFASTEGDVVVFRSIDHVLFNVHRVNLRVNTTGPFSEDFHAPKGDVADLTEDAETLELLFSFVYAKQHQTLSNLPFEKQLRLAEAAEKYGVAPAKTVCHLLFKYTYKDHPLELLSYAYKHEHIDLLDACAARVIGTPIEKVYVAVPPSLCVAWVRYRTRPPFPELTCFESLYNDQWLPTILGVFRMTEFGMNHECRGRDTLKDYIGSRIRERQPAAFFSSPPLLRELSTLVYDCRNLDHSDGVPDLINSWTSRLAKALGKEIRPLSSYLKASV